MSGRRPISDWYQRLLRRYGTGDRVRVLCDAWVVELVDTPQERTERGLGRVERVDQLQRGGVAYVVRLGSGHTVRVGPGALEAA